MATSGTVFPGWHNVRVPNDERPTQLCDSLWLLKSGNKKTDHHTDGRATQAEKEKEKSRKEQKTHAMPVDAQKKDTMS